MQFDNLKIWQFNMAIWQNCGRLERKEKTCPPDFVKKTCPFPFYCTLNPPLSSSCKINEGKMRPPPITTASQLVGVSYELLASVSPLSLICHFPLSFPLSPGDPANRRWFWARPMTALPANRSSRDCQYLPQNILQLSVSSFPHI